MSRFATYNRIWGEGIPPSSCQWCENRPPTFFMSIKGTRDNPRPVGYFCTWCFMGLILGSLARHGDLDIALDPLWVFSAQELAAMRAETVPFDDPNGKGW